MEIKQYNKQPIPKDTAWDRNGKYPLKLFYKLPSWFRGFCYSIGSLFSWFKIVWKDRHWDYGYIYDTLQFKLEKTRDYIVKHNRLTKTEEVNRDITICLNLIEKVKTEYYGCEYLEYTPGFTGDPSKTLALFFSKNKLQHKKAIKYIEKNKHRYSKPVINEKLQAMVLSQLKQQKAKKLLFTILEEKIERWWD